MADINKSTTDISDLGQSTNEIEPQNITEEKITVEKLYYDIIEKSPKKGCGKFQMMMSTIVMLGLSSFGYIEYGLGYIELFPQFDCYLNGNLVSDCSTDQICQGQSTNQTEYIVNYQNHTSLHNWVEQLDLVCVSGEKIGLIGSMFFAGWSSTILFIPFFSDKIGRRWIFFGAMFMTLSCMIGMYSSHSINFTISLMFIAGMATSGRTTVGYVLANEFLAPKWQVVFGTIFNFIDGCTGLILTLYFDFISKYYFWMSSLGSVFAALSVVGMLFLAFESPLWLLKMGRVAAAQRTIRKMMKMNGVECEDEINALETYVYQQKSIDRISEVRQEEEEVQLDSGLLQASEAVVGDERSTMFYLKQPVIRVNLVVMSYMWAAVSFTYYMIAFQLKYLPGNIYNNSLASGGSELVAIACAGLLYGRLGMKKSFSGLFGLSAFGGLMILFLGESSTFWMPFFVVFAKFGIAGAFVIVYVSTVDVFPTLFCATALGFCNFFARVLTILAPEVAERPPPLPMILFVSLTLIGIILIQFVKPLKEQEIQK